MARWVILGKGGHAAVLRWALEQENGEIVSTESDDDVRPDDYLAIGMGDMERRRAKYVKFGDHRFPPVIHPATVYPSSIAISGLQLMAGAIVQPGCLIGYNVLINTGAQIDHDCTIGDHCIISPGAILCGNVELGEACEIGAGAIIVQGVKLVAETKIPAGSLVVGPNDVRRPRRAN